MFRLRIINYHIDHIVSFVTGPIVYTAAAVVCHTPSDHLGATGRQCSYPGAHCNPPAGSPSRTAPDTPNAVGAGRPAESGLRVFDDWQSRNINDRQLDNERNGQRQEKYEFRPHPGLIR